MRIELCEKCGLHSGCVSPMMPADMVGDKCDVLFVGEAPGEQEDKDNKPFVGRSGQLLREVVNDYLGASTGAVYTNVLRCRPPHNKTPTTKQIKCCRPNLLADIDRYTPRLIMPLGNVPLRALLGESGITNWRGVVIDKGGRTYIPTFHPAYILRNYSMLQQWAEDFDKADQFLQGFAEAKDISDTYDLRVVTDYDAAFEMYCTIWEKGICGWDTETNGLRYGDRLVAMSFAIQDPNIAWCVLFTDSEDVSSVCKRLLEDDGIKKIGHNIKFDSLVARACLGANVVPIVGDSMLLSYVVDPVPGRHGLKQLAGRHLGMYEYAVTFDDYLAGHKEADPKYNGDLRKVPMEMLARYSSLDAVATLELHAKLYAELDDKLRAVYEDLLVPASGAFTDMEENGMVVDDHIISRYIKIYSKVQGDQHEKVLADTEIQAYTRARMNGNAGFEFNLNSPDQVRDVLFGTVVCPECGKSVGTWDGHTRRRHECEKCNLEFKSAGTKYYGMKSVGLTKTGRPTTAWDAIKVYINEVPFLEDYRYYKLLGKMLSTYLAPAKEVWKDSDARVRSTFLLHGTETGRSASRNPNLQNIPTPEKEPGTLLEALPIKNIFTHTWEDGCLMAVDYSGMELRTMASVSHCVGMMGIFERGEDPHDIVTELLMGIKKEDYQPKEWKSLRYHAKWTNWTLLFGGSEYTLHRLYGLDIQEARRLIHTYYGEFPEILEHKENTIRFAKEHGYVESPMGRRRYLPYINDRDESRRAKAERSAINMPIQSAAFDVLLCALIIINSCMKEQGFKSLMVNMVHDSIVFDVYPGELDELAWLCVEIMENITTEYGPTRFPGLDFSWFTVPLVADVEVGSHYGCMELYKEYNENLD